MAIKVKFSTVDRFSESRSFKTVKGAQAYAHKCVGEHPEIGSHYAVSADGIGKVTVTGATLTGLFPEPTTGASHQASEQEIFEAAMRADAERDAAQMAEAYPAEPPLTRNAKCICSDPQLIHVGCDCAAGDPW